MSVDASSSSSPDPGDAIESRGATGNITFASACGPLPSAIGIGPFADRLNVAAEHTFDRIADLAAHLFDTPSAFISLLHDDCLWFKAATGIDGDFCPLDTSFCQDMFDQRELLVVPDAVDDPRFRDNPLVQATPGIRFYAGAPLITDDGDIIGSICVLDDEPRTGPVDPEKRKHLAHLAEVVMDELELRREVQRGEEREKALREARNNAEAAKETLSQFFAGVTHDLRTPLTRMLLFNDLLERILTSTEQEEKGHQYTEKIRVAGSRMNMLITSLLDLAELRSGRLALDLEPINMQEVVTEACESVEILSASSTDRLRVTMPSTPLFARADSAALTRVLDNLIGNAIKHTHPDDLVRVNVRVPFSESGPSGAGDHPPRGDGSADSVDPAVLPALLQLPARGPSGDDAGTHIDGESVLIEVLDNGPGIPEDLVDTLFDPYTRGPKRSKADDEASKGGVGLGLAITSDLVSAMNGAIHVHTKEGLGTCFHIHLPAAEKD
jgi:signal transduction histidine kinase